MRLYEDYREFQNGLKNKQQALESQWRMNVKPIDDACKKMLVTINAISDLSMIYRGISREYSTSTALRQFTLSLDDQFITAGSDSCGGYLRYATTATVNKWYRKDSKQYLYNGATAQILVDGNARVRCKTNVPITLMSLVGGNDIFGQPKNIHNAKFACGGSSAAAVVTSGWVEVGISTDIWGGVRVPAAWNGCYSLKMSSRRWPVAGMSCGYEGIIGIKPVTSPLARNTASLRSFIESAFSLGPWKYDPEAIAGEWQRASTPRCPRVGVMVLDDFLPPTPAQARALQVTRDALFLGGCKMVDFKPPLPSVEYDELIHKLYYADGFRKITANLLPFEHNDPHVAKVARYAKLPRCLQILWEKILHLLGFTELERMYRCQRSPTFQEYLNLITKRNTMRLEFAKAWDHAKLDFLVTIVHPSPAVPIGTKDTFWTILYTSLFNLLDYPAGVVPVSTVDKDIDQLPLDLDYTKLSYPAKVVFDTYNPVEMDGLPTAIQVVTKRSENENEKALLAMEFIVDALKKVGVSYNKPVF